MLTDDKKRLFVTQSNYVPWKGFFDAIRMADVYIVYDEVQYTKNDWRNRNYIKTPKGREWMTIPVKTNSLEQKISETEVSDKRWPKKHWGSLQANYAKAPYFKELAPRIKAIYDELADETSLSNINFRFITEICDMLGIDTQIVQSSELDMSGDKNERLLRFCKQFNVDVYCSGAAAKSYLDESIFNDAGIEVHWLDYSGYPEYPQLYPPFEHGVTVLDLLFNTGDDALKYMKQAL